MQTSVDYPSPHLRFDRSAALNVHESINLFRGSLGLVIAYEELGQNRETRAEAAETMRINPQFALPSPEEGYFKDVAFNERVDKELRKAGLK
jgi:hypothetical protein